MSVGQVGWWGRKDEVCGFASHFGALAAGSKPKRLKLVCVGGLVRVRLSGIEISGCDDGGYDAAAAARDGCDDGMLVCGMVRWRHSVCCLRCRLLLLLRAWYW